MAVDDSRDAKRLGFCRVAKGMGEYGLAAGEWLGGCGWWACLKVACGSVWACYQRADGSMRMCYIVCHAGIGWVDGGRTSRCDGMVRS